MLLTFLKVSGIQKASSSLEQAKRVVVLRSHHVQLWDMRNTMHGDMKVKHKKECAIMRDKLVCVCLLIAIVYNLVPEVYTWLPGTDGPIS